MGLDEFRHLDEDEFLYCMSERLEEELLDKIQAREKRYGITSEEALDRVKDGLLLETKDILAWINDYNHAKREGLL